MHYEDYGFNSKSFKKNIHLETLYNQWNHSLSKLMNDLPLLDEIKNKYLQNK